MSTYNREHSYESFAPKVENDTFLNEAVAGDGTPNELIALIDASGYCPLVPGNPAIENLPIVHPERNDEEVRQDGDGLGVSEVYDLGWSDGAASKMSKCIFGLHIKDTLGKLLHGGITGTVAEIFTVETIADVAGSLDELYFEFDGVDAGGNNPIVKYYCWMNGGGAAPDPDGRVAVPIAVGGGDSAIVIATAVQVAIDALDDFSAVNVNADNDIKFTALTKIINDAVDDWNVLVFQAGDTITVAGSGSNDGTYTIVTVSGKDLTVSEALVEEVAGAAVTVSSPRVAVTNGTLGAVDDAHDVNSGFTVTRTTDGVTKKVISESTTLSNIAFHDEKEGTADIRIDILGVTQLEYTWSCEEKGKLEEERNYLTAWFMDNETNTVLDLTRPRGPDGTQWLTQHPYSKYKKNFEWGSLKGRITFQYNGTDVECKITSISIKASIEVDYKRDDGSSYSNGREIKARNYEITMTIRPTGSMLRSINKLHYSAYAGDITLTAKAQRGDDTNDYQEWEFTKLRLLPIPQDLLVEPYYEEFDIVLHAAPGNVGKAEILGYLSQQYYGVD